ncbi:MULTISPECIES: glycoside hydrolase family 2 protein [unclassified Carboxylicivirga]|uniref:glycoside hydrolase family 2 protein n=1 Tax=Carboxylicivirga TaxID=1628153 RepID=UPI003D330EA0
MIKYFTNIVALLLLISSAACAQNNSNTISLNGTWNIVFDDANEGVVKKWFLNEEFSKLESKHIEVPSCWEETEENYEGVGFYTRNFTIPANWEGKIVEIDFDAVNYYSEVWINEQVVGFHEGGYTPFSFRIDKLLKFGEENTIMVRVVSPIILTDKRIDGMGRQEVPMWRGAITGGIWQGVNLSAKGHTHLADVFIEPRIASNEAVLNMTVNNADAFTNNKLVEVSIEDAKGNVVAYRKESIVALPGKNKLSWSMKIEDVKYWSMDNPYLYKANVSVLDDKVLEDKWSHKFGMREFSVKDDQFTLNGNPLYLKATFFEGLYPVKLAYPDSREMAIKEITLAKEAGFNMIRPWRKPAPPMWLDLCDSLGVLTVGSLVMECMLRPISTPRLSYVVENELRETILNNRNRTCVVQWELFNEINRPILTQMLNSMSVLARELDPTRMILDESGGWGEGANIYLPYEQTPMKFNDIHHYSGSQVCEAEFNGYLATAKTKEEKENSGIIDAKGYGKHVVPGMMTYLSEVGYGSTPDLISNNEEFKKKGNPIVAPPVYHKALNDGYVAALKKVGFDKIYSNVQDLYFEEQKIHGIANKRMLEAIRLNSTVKGYCVHALVGGDWVLGAGLLDLWRNPKTLVYDMTKAANQPQIAPIRILPRNVYAQKGALLQVFGVSELADEKAVVDVQIKDGSKKVVWSEKLNTNFTSGISTFIDVKLDTKDYSGSYTVEVSVSNESGEMITKNEQPFDVFTTAQLASPKAKVAVVDDEGSLKAFLDAKGVQYLEFTKELDKSIPVLVGKGQKKDKRYQQTAMDVKAFVEQGGYAVFLETVGNKIPGFDRVLHEVDEDALPLNAELHAKWATRGGWAAKSHIVTEHSVFDGLPTNQIMHGVYENVHPVESMSKIKGQYIAGMIGYDHFPNNDVMVRHYNGPGEVWWAADVLEANIGKGQMLMSTLRIIDFLDKDPVAEKLLFNIMNYATSQAQQ